VCTGTTGHVEVARVTFTCDYGELLRFFFTFHDPTTRDRQGNDRGTQYASVIFVENDVQQRVAEETVRDLRAKLPTTFQGTDVVTEVRDATTFYPAHEAHQRYLEKNPGGYCNHRAYLSTFPTS